MCEYEIEHRLVNMMKYTIAIKLSIILWYCLFFNQLSISRNIFTALQNVLNYPIQTGENPNSVCTDDVTASGKWSY